MKLPSENPNPTEGREVRRFARWSLGTSLIFLASETISPDSGVLHAGLRGIFFISVAYGISRLTKVSH